MRRSTLKGLLLLAVLLALALPYWSTPGDRTPAAARAAAPSSHGAVVPFAGLNAITPSSTPVPPTATTTGTVVPTVTLTPLIFPTTIITATLVISPQGGPPASMVSIQSAPGATLPPNSTATITFVDSTGFNPPVVLGTAQIGASSVISTTVALPAQAPAGASLIQVTDGGATQSGRFIILPQITLSPTAVLPGGTVTVTGDGFAPGNTITFFLGSTPIAPAVPVTTNQLGHFVTTLVIPSTQPLGVTQIAAGGAIVVGGVQNSAIASLVIGSLTPTVTPTGTATVPTGPSSTPTLLPTAPPRGTATPVGGGAVRAYFAEGYTGRAATNGKATFTEVLDILNPTAAAAGVTITYYIQGSTTPMLVQRSVGAHAILRELVNTDVGPDKIVAATVASPAALLVSRTITRADAKGARLDGSTTVPVTAPSTSWAFPEGYTGVTFQEYLTVLNPSASAAAVTVRLAPQAATDAGAHTLNLNVPAHSRATANIRALNQGNSARSIGMLITSTVPIVAERVEYFGAGAGSDKFGATVTAGIPSGDASTQLRFAFGSSGGKSGSGAQAQPTGDQDYITLLNPALGGSAVKVTASFSDAAGHQLGSPVTVSVAPGTRQTIIANTVIGAGAANPFSVAINADGPIMAESAQYFGGSPNVGEHPGVAFPAAIAPETSVLLSALSTALADGTALTRTLYLYNPETTAAQVQATYFTPTGAQLQATYTVPANGITAVNVHTGALSAIAAGPLGASLRATAGAIVAVAVGQSADGRVALEDVGTGS